MPMPASPTRTLVEPYNKISLCQLQNLVIGFSRLSRLATGRGFLDSDYAFNAYLLLPKRFCGVDLIAITLAQYLSFPLHAFILCLTA